MKVKQLKLIIKEAVKEAIQEEMKEILLEAISSSKQTITSAPTATPKPLPKEDKLKLRENMMNVLDGMMPGADGTLSATSANVPLQVKGPMDTTSANGTLPEGNVSMDQIMGVMNSKG